MKIEYDGIGFDIDIGDSVQEMIDKLGAQVVYSHAQRSIYESGRDSLRRKVRDGKSKEEILAKMQAWRPAPHRGMKTGKTPAARFAEKIRHMTPADRLATINAYTERIKKAQIEAQKRYEQTNAEMWGKDRKK